MSVFKKNIKLLLLIIAIPLLLAEEGQGNEYCFDIEYPTECLYYDLGYFLCCPSEYTVCCSNAQGDIWCCPDDYPICGDVYEDCYSSNTPVTTSLPISTTTIMDIQTTSTVPSVSTTSVPSGTATTTISQYCADDPDNPVECLDYEKQQYWCCPEDSPVCGQGDEYGQCLHQDSSTTTISGGGTATTTIISGGGTAGDFIVGINVRGENNSRPESSGVLPGTSPSEVKPALYNTEGRIIPMWYDKQFPFMGPDVMKKTKEILERKKKRIQTRKIKALDTGEQQDFWVKDEKDKSWRQVTATNRKSGTYSYVFVDNTLTVPDSILEMYATEFDFMYSRVLSPDIGDFYDRDENGKVAILLYDMNDTGSVNMYMGGYFWSKDYMADSETAKYGIRSNEMDVVYIRGDVPTGWEQVGGDFYQYNLTTLVHECQHLIHFCIMVWEQGNSGKSSDVWIDEMMAMSCETMYFKEKLKVDPFFTHPSMQGNGYLSGRIEYYSVDPQKTIRNGHGLCYWDNKGDVLANYSLAYLMGQYLALHSSSGDGVYKDILNYMLSNDVHDYQAVAGAAARTVSGISSWEDLLKSYAIANIANQAGGPFGYNGELFLVANGPTRNKADIHNGGAVYRQVDGQWEPPSGTGPDVQYYDATGTLIPTTVAKGLCAASRMLGSRSHESDILRKFRDRVLFKSDTGEQLVESYYEYTDELTSILVNNPEIALGARKLLLELIPVVQDSIKGREVHIDRSMEQQISDLCDMVWEKAGPGLKDVIEDFQDNNFYENIW